MQGKALVALLLSLGALALWGCGGSDDGTASTSAAGDAQSPAGNLQAARRQAEEEQQRLEEETGTASGGGEKASSGGDGEGDAAADPPRWLKQHHDSGGGAGQFEVAGGDNSVQEYGAEADSGQREEAAAALHAFLDARVAREWAAACAYLSVSAIIALEQIPQITDHPEVSGCPEILAALGSEAAQRLLVKGAVADVGALRIEGDSGFILYHGADGNDFVMPMVRDDGSWKVGSVEPVPLGA